MRICRTLNMLLVAATLAVVAVTAAADEDPVPRILATGEGSASLVPDMAIVTMTVTREAETARTALDANSSAMESVIAAMGQQGIAGKDMQTTGFSIQPRYIYPKPRGEAPPKIAGYTVRNSLTIKVRKLADLGVLLDQSVSLGVNEGGNVRFANDDPSEALAEARAAAVKDAMARAETMASAAGVKTGRVLEISEASPYQGPRPAMMESVAMGRSADAVPMATGENMYKVSVSLSVAIEQ